jgi:hypothetical protein
MVIVTGVSLLSCKAEPVAGGQIDQLKKELDATVNDALKKIEGLGSETDKLHASATEEVEKLFMFEYKVAEIPLRAEKDEVNEKLSALGKDRWDCFYVEPKKDVLRFYCKRRPLSYLRYVPKLL